MQMRFVYPYLLLLFIISIPHISYGKHFKVIDISNGLSNNTVKCIEQDKFGFLWFGTYDGLCRYDGVNFTVFRHNKKDSLSIRSNFVTTIVADEHGLWVGTGAGLSFLSFKDYKFSPAAYTSNGKATRINGAIRKIIKAGNKIIALSSLEGLLELDKNRTFHQLSFDVSQNEWQMIAPYSATEFLAHSSEGLFLLNSGERTVKSKLLYTLNQPVDHIYYSKNQDRIFLGSGIGRNSKVFQVQNGLIKMMAEKVPPALKSTIDYNNGVTFGTDGGGLVFSQQDTMDAYIPGNSDISSDAIYSLFVDRDNNLWVGTFRGGINVYNDQNNWFTSFSMQNGRLRHNFVTSIYESDDNNLYIGTDGGGLNIFNRATSKLRHYTTTNSRISGNNIVSIAGDDQHIWMGIYGKGLNCFTTASERFINYDLPTIPYVHERNTIWVIRDDKKDNLWIGAETGLYIFNKQTRKFVLIQQEVQRISEISFAKNSVWVSTNGNGLYQLEYSGKIIKQYSGTATGGTLANNQLRYVFVDSKQQVWFGAEHTGLYKLNPDTDELSLYGPEQGFENPNVLGITEDVNDHLWISSYNGLFRFNPADGSFSRFGIEDHLSSAQFNYNACYHKGGTMYFGTSKGLITFKPDQMHFDRKFKEVIFTDFELLNQKNNESFEYEKPSRVIKLSYNQNFFSINFTIPELVSPEKIRYSFYMDNFESGWSPAGTRRQVTYTNVPPGEYNFRVRSTNAAGEWNEHHSSLRIIIAPPWWWSNWAIGLFILILLCIIMALLKFYRYQLSIKHMVQIKEIEKSTEKNINEAKLTFFTNISHELRTPVFLLTAPLEDLLANKERLIPVKRSHLLSMLKSATRLNKLISRVIDFRKIEAGKLFLELQTGNVVSFCKDLMPEYESLCHTKGILLLFMPSKLDITLTFDPEKLESILSNLISNAFKYTNEDGKIVFSIDEEPNEVVFSIEDNGIGIEEEHYETIFNQFFQVDNRQKVGDGIGLTFVKNLVEIHGGRISVTGKLNQGSKFTFTIPKHLVVDNGPANLDVGHAHLKPLSNREPAHSFPDPGALNTVLVVDDEADIRELIEQLLSGEYRVIKANDGAEALDIVHASPPDIIICDVMMPKMNGIEFTTQLKADKIYGNIPVIMLTARSGEENMLDAFACGADAYLTKPVSVKFLRQRVKQILTQADSSDLGQFIAGKQTSYSKHEKVFMMKCKNIIDENLTNPEFGISLLSKELGMSHSSVYKKIKSMTGKSIIEFINTYKIFKAVKMFNDGERSISTVGTKCGFNDAKSFREAFKQRMGVAPKEYIKGDG